MRTVLFGVLSAAMVVSIQVPPSAPAARPAPGATLTGRVVTGNGVDARPVRRAKLTLTGGGLTAPRQGDTDASGAYRFDRLPSGPFKIRVQKPGFVTLDADAAADATLTLTRGGAIEGIITDAAGEPVWNVVVTAMQMEGGKPKAIAQTRTDDLGGYRVHSLPSGDYFVEVATDRAFIVQVPLVAGEKAPEINKAYYPAAASIEDAKSILVTAGRDATGVDVTFSPARPVKDAAQPPPPPRPDRNGTGRIAGIVIDATTGKPVRAAQILLLPAPGQGQQLTDWTRTDAQGRFEYTHLPPQRYTLRFQSPRYVTLE